MKAWRLFLTSILCVVSMRGPLLRAASTVPNGRVSVRTVETGIPSAVFEWQESELFEEEGIYGFECQSPIPFTGLSVGWLCTDANNIDPGAFTLAIRARSDEEPCEKWVVTRGEVRPDENLAGLFWSALYIPPDCNTRTQFEVRLRPPEEVRISFARISVADTSSGLLVTQSFEKEVEEDTMVTEEPLRPPIITRSEWWGDLPPEELYSPRWWPPTYRDITHSIIHHTVTYNNPPNPAQVVRSIWHYHANDNGWGDIGYNFLVDQYGNIYQGRYNEYLDTQDVHAAHAGTYNYQSLGIAFIGQFHPSWPDPPAGDPDVRALESTEELLAWKFAQRSLDPLEQATLVDKYIYRIAGHRDVSATACPGDNLYSLLPGVRTNVDGLISGGFPSPPMLISPADGSHQNCRITFEWSSVSGATMYRIFLKPPGRPIWVSDETAATTYEYSPTVIGAYCWKVQAYGDGRWSEDSEEWCWYLDGLYVGMRDACDHSITQAEYNLWVTFGKPACWWGPCHCRGDSNDDCQLNAVDVLALRGCWPGLGGSYDPCCDTNYDGVINAVDVLALRGAWPGLGGAGCLGIPCCE